MMTFSGVEDFCLAANEAGCVQWGGTVEHGMACLHILGLGGAGEIVPGKNTMFGLEGQVVGMLFLADQCEEKPSLPSLHSLDREATSVPGKGSSPCPFLSLSLP